MGLLRMKNSRALLAGAAVLACAAVFAGCSDDITVDRDPSVRIQKGMTWAWRPQPQAEEMHHESGRKVISQDLIPQRNAPPQREFPKNSDVDNEIVRNRTRIAFEHTLASKGLKQVNDPAAADFLVDYQIGVERRSKQVASPVLVCGYYGCWQSWGYWGPPGYVVRTVRYREGSIVFDLVRRADNKMAYRASAQRELKPDSLQPDKVNSGVQKLLKKLEAQR